MRYFYIFFLCVNFAAWSQKETTQTFEAGNLNRIVVDSDEIYRVSVQTAPGSLIRIKTKTDGEYFNNISLDSEIQNEVLVVKSRFREILRSGFDKLSAHKVFAMEIVLQIPEEMQIEIRSNLASVFMEGAYEQVLIQVKSGSVFLEGFRGDAVVNTYNGNIEVETENASVEAESRHGKVILPETLKGDYRLKLKSINGSIKVRETK